MMIIEAEINDIVDGYDYPITMDKDTVISMMYDLVEVLGNRIDSIIKDWGESFEHHRQKEEEWKQKENWEFMDLHHSMKIYSNGAAQGLEFFKNELTDKNNNISHKKNGSVKRKHKEDDGGNIQNDGKDSSSSS